MQANILPWLPARVPIHNDKNHNFDPDDNQHFDHNNDWRLQALSLRCLLRRFLFCMPTVVLQWMPTRMSIYNDHDNNQHHYNEHFHNNSHHNLNYHDNIDH